MSDTILTHRNQSVGFNGFQSTYRALALALVISWTMLSAPLTNAATFFWDGGGADTDLLTAENWNPDGAPSPALTTTGAEGVAQLHFAAGVPSLITSAAAQLFAGELNFDSGAATPYTIGSSSTNIEFAMRTAATIIDNENTGTANLQLAFNLGDGSALRVATIKAGNGDIFFDGGSGYLYMVNSNANSHRDFLLGKNITLSSQMRLTGVTPLNVYGLAGTGTLTGDTTGVLTLNGATGQSNTNNNSHFTGIVNLWSGKLRIGNSTALGRTTNITNVHGTFVASTSTQAQLSGGYEHGFGTLELYNNVVLDERVRIDSRIGDAADFDQINNVSDSNVINLWNIQGGAGHFNIRSTSGTLTINNGNIHVSDGPRTDSVAADVINSIYTFRGAGNIVFNSMLGQESGFGGAVVGTEGNVSSMVRKQDAGILTLGSATNDWDGGTLIEGGSIVVAAGGSFSTSGLGTTRTIIHSGATLDASATAGLSFGANTRLNGTGLVKGNVTTTDANTRIQPGGFGTVTPTGPNGSDALSYTGGAGKLTLDNDLNMTAAGMYQWGLEALSAAPGNAGITYDQLLVNGALTLGGSSVFDISTNSIAPADLPGGANNNPFWLASHSWIVLDQTNGANTQQFAALTLFGGPNGPITLNGAGDLGTLSLGLNAGGDPVLNYNYVPEPSACLLAVLGLFSLSGRALRGRRS